MKSRLVLFCLFCLSITGLLAGKQISVDAVDAGVAPRKLALTSESWRVFLPWISYDYLSPSNRLCRFGVGGSQSISSYKVNELKIGWYIDWTASPNPARPGGIDYMPMVRLEQTGPDSYTYRPYASLLMDTIAARPGSTWLIGNEPDRKDWQDDLLPDVYARAYHDLYYLIKGTDPTARIAAGGIVQSTPLRLQYLDMVLASYEALYAEPMPVDVWNIHAFILREETGSWGADIPPGIDANQGELYEIDDNDNIEIFKENIERFRRWMASNNYQNRPLIITEFGVQMPTDYGFPPDRVKDFMDASFGYLLTATDAETGYPYDDHRLVQQWAWYSLYDDNFNGWLFDSDTKARTVYGDHFAAYTGQVESAANLTVVDVDATPVVDTSGDVVSATLHARVVNNGNTVATGPWDVHFYREDPQQGKTLLGEHTLNALDGCATSLMVDFEWTDATPGSHVITIAIDPSDVIDERNENDNILTDTLTF